MKRNLIRIECNQFFMRQRIEKDLKKVMRLKCSGSGVYTEHGDLVYWSEWER